MVQRRSAGFGGWQPRRRWARKRRRPLVAKYSIVLKPGLPHSSGTRRPARSTPRGLDRTSVLLQVHGRILMYPACNCDSAQQRPAPIPELLRPFHQNRTTHFCSELPLTRITVTVFSQNCGHGLQSRTWTVSCQRQGALRCRAPTKKSGASDGGAGSYPNHYDTAMSVEPA